MIYMCHCSLCDVIQKINIYWFDVMYAQNHIYRVCLENGMTENVKSFG
jgi:hypothetical protein